MNKNKYAGTLTLEVLEWAHKYNKWIADEISPHVSFPLLELGAGIGNISYHFTKNIPKGSTFYISEIDTHLISILRKKYNKKNIKVIKLDITKVSNKLYLNKFKAVFAINVLEHIENDLSALKNSHKLLQKNGLLILLVPAKMYAYSNLDKELGHYRRYEKDELIKKISDAKFTIESIKYFNIVGLLSWMVRNKFEQEHRMLRPYQIWIFEKIVPFLKALESFIPIPVGISLIVVARKK